MASANCALSNRPIVAYFRFTACLFQWVKQKRIPFLFLKGQVEVSWVQLFFSVWFLKLSSKQLYKLPDFIMFSPRRGKCLLCTGVGRVSSCWSLKACYNRVCHLSETTPSLRQVQVQVNLPRQCTAPRKPRGFKYQELNILRLSSERVYLYCTVWILQRSCNNDQRHTKIQLLITQNNLKAYLVPRVLSFPSPGAKERERDRRKRWSRVSQNLGDDKT